MSGGGKGSSTTVPHYHAAAQMVLGLGVVDEIQKIDFGPDHRVGWTGSEAGDPTGYGEITVNKKGLFGGDKMEGGVAGKIDVGMGYPNQPRNAFLAAVLDPLISAYRGMTTLIFKDFYWGNNPYPKAPYVWAKSIHKMWDGSQQWYDEKAEIPDVKTSLIFSAGRLVSYFIGNTSYTGYDETEESDWEDLYGNTINLGVFDYIDDAVSGQNYSLVQQTKTFDYYPGWVTRLASAIKHANGADSFISFEFLASGSVVAAIEVRKLALNQLELRYGSDLSNLEQAPYTVGTDGFSSVLVNGEFVFNQTELVYTNIGTNSVDGYVQDWEFGCDPSGIDSVRVVAGPLSITSFPTIPGAVTLSWVVSDFTALANTGDINPAHFVREIHTNPIWGGRFPEAKMGATYTFAADTFFDEGFGISPLFTQRLEYQEMIAEVIRHVDAIAYEDLDTGLMELKPIRAVAPESIEVTLDESNSELEHITLPQDFEAVNQIIVHFWNRETGEDDSVTVTNDAAITPGRPPNTKEVEYPFFTSKRTAMMAALRDLARESRPFAKGRVRVNRKLYKLKEGDVFIGNWPEENVVNMICRVAERKEQGLLNPDIIIEFGEDIFGAAFTTYATPPETAWVDPIGDPRALRYETAFELPYYLAVQQLGETGVAQVASDAAFYAFAGVEPTEGAHADYDLYAYPDGTTQEPDAEFGTTADFTPIAIVSAAVDDLTETVIPVLALDGMDSVRAGHLIMVGDAADTDREILVLNAAAADGDLSISVKRGLIDTVPRPIPAGSVLYFIGTFYGNSQTEFTVAEVVEGYGTPRNGYGIFDGPYTYHDLDMQGRIYKPYPPGNLQIDGQSYPGAWYVPPSHQVVFDWAYRDRVLQSDQAIDHFDAEDYGPEALTTYLIEADAYDADGLLLQANWFSQDVGLVKTYTLDLDLDTPPANTTTIMVRIWTVRDGETSLQTATVTFINPGQEIIADEYTGLPILDIDGNYIASETPQ